MGNPRLHVALPSQMLTPSPLLLEERRVRSSHVFRQGLLDSVFKEALVSRGLSEHLRRGINRITRTQVQAS